MIESAGPYMVIDFNVDERKFKHKPKSAQVGGIRTRMKHVTVEPDKLLEVIKNGQSYYPAYLTGTTADTFQSQQIFCLDIDNSERIPEVDPETGEVKKDDKGHTSYKKNPETGEQIKRCIESPCTPDDAKRILSLHQITPFCMYKTFSCTDTWPRFRIVHVLDKPVTDGETATEMTNTVMHLIEKEFPGSTDSATSDNARLFYGSTPDSIIFEDKKIALLDTFQSLTIERLSEKEPKAETEEKQSRNYDSVSKYYVEKDELRTMIENVDLAGYISKTEKIEKKYREGNRTVFNPCPICGHNDCFKIYDKSPYSFFCFSSDHDRGGTIIDFQIQKDKITRGESIRYFLDNIAKEQDLSPVPVQPKENGGDHKQQTKEAMQIAGNVKEESETDLDIPSFDDIEEKPIEWLIPKYIPKGQITILCGTGGVGKTSVWSSIVSSLSSGTKSIFDGDTSIGEIKREPKKVFVFSGEDDAERTLKKKLRQQGATMKNVKTLLIGDPRFDKVQFGSKYLERLLKKHRPDLCVFDPIQSFIDPKIKMSDRNAIRQNMRHLIGWGSNYETTFLVVMHSNKLQNAWGRNRMADSADIWDIARSVLMVGETENEEIRYMSHEKSNYGKPGMTMLFKNVEGITTWYSWTDEKDRDFVTANAKKRSIQKESATVEEIKEFIISSLTDYSDGLTSAELVSLLHDAGYKQWAIEKAKSELKLQKKIVYKRTGKKDPWIVKKAQKY